MPVALCLRLRALPHRSTGLESGSMRRTDEMRIFRTHTEVTGAELSSCKQDFIFNEYPT